MNQTRSPYVRHRLALLESAKAHLDDLRKKRAPRSQIGRAEESVRLNEREVRVAEAAEPAWLEREQARAKAEQERETAKLENYRQRWRLDHPEADPAVFDELRSEIVEGYQNADREAAQARARRTYAISL